MNRSVFEMVDLHKLWLLGDPRGERANFRKMNLRWVDLSFQDLRQADLSQAKLHGCYLFGADLQGAQMPPLKLPSSGQITGYKKVIGGIILELLIDDAPRTGSYVGTKCRCSRAKVIAAYKDGVKMDTQDGQEFCSIFQYSFKYKMGEWVEEPNYDGDPRVECAPGIHFFMTKEEAEEYSYP